MIVDLIRIWNQKSFTAKTVDEFVSMLDSSEEMLSYTFRVLLGEIPANESTENIYRKDQSINFRERDIRKRILVHLTASPGGNLPACLALISVSKDAERLGDYVKNFFELRKLLKGSERDHELFTSLFDRLGKEVLGLFRETAKAFRNSDRDLAIQVVHSGRDLGKRCEDVIEKVADSDYQARQAVVIALGARYLKRIALHLSNIASSVINPMPELDYLDTGEK
jgi:phosphate transport system protein